MQQRIETAGDPAPVQQRQTRAPRRPAAFDFTRPFLPDCLARAADEPLLRPHEALLLNQIRGHGYLAVFSLLEEFILPSVLAHLQGGATANLGRAHALLVLAGEEARRLASFRRLRARFAGAFGTACEAIGPADAVRREVLAHPPLSVALAMLHIGCMVQRHHEEAGADRGRLEPRFRALLHRHAVEKARHRALERSLVLALARSLPREALLAGVAGYLDIAAYFDEGLRQQAAFDLTGLERALGRALPERDRRLLLARQHQANRWTYLGSGMSHPALLAVLGELDPQARQTVERVVPLYG